MSNICMIGTGYVGLVTGTCLADLGNQVTCLDIIPEKIASLQAGIVPIHEPGLVELVARNVQAGRLRFTTSYAEALGGDGGQFGPAEFIFIAVNTPPSADGRGADLTFVQAAAHSIGAELDHDAVIINKSTVPIGSGTLVSNIIAEHVRGKGLSFAVVSNPEFLREGSAIQDFQHPDRVVLGSTMPQAAQQVAQLYLPLRAPILITDLATAEMIKYASNALLATKISFINEIAQICEQLGADVKEVATGIGYDRRLGRAFLDAGIGYGGSCFPKDVAALAHMADQAGLHPQMLHAVMDINRDQRQHIVRKLASILGNLRGATIGILGLAFKPDTDDMREAPSVDIIRALVKQGAQVRAYDPVARRTAKQVLGDIPVTYCQDAYAVAEGCDALVLVTDWNEFKSLDMHQIRETMRLPVLIDGRNMYEPARMLELGFIYQGIGRASATPSPLSNGNGHDRATVQAQSRTLREVVAGARARRQRRTESVVPVDAMGLKYAA
jgi:UDPglucose 6-dehydrogenase